MTGQTPSARHGSDAFEVSRPGHLRTALAARLTAAGHAARPAEGPLRRWLGRWIDHWEVIAGWWWLEPEFPYASYDV